MEYNCSKRNSRKRRRKRRHNKQAQSKVEVRAEKKQRVSKDYRQQSNYATKEKLINTMDANAFWENYSAAHEWQKRHNTTWWKTRCFALEHENHVLKETIRNLMQNQNGNSTLPKTNYIKQEYSEEKVENDEENCADDNLEFHLNEDMMSFLAQSIRHKIELKTQRDNEASDQESQSNEQSMENVLEKSQKRKEEGKSLYGEASTKILAMETALQATVDRHIDRAKPQYWPNIPLNL